MPCRSYASMVRCQLAACHPSTSGTTLHDISYCLSALLATYIITAACRLTGFCQLLLAAAIPVHMRDH